MSETTTSSRLEAFCDGVFAIAITLLIIDVKIPSSEKIESNADFVRALKHVAPSIFAFLLSFIIILITWVNHHNAMKLGNRVSSLFIYANGYLLLTVVFMPFPSSLVGEHIFTDHAAPAFNSRYLLDVADEIDGDGLQMVLADAVAPTLVRDMADAMALYVLMPMRV